MPAAAAKSDGIWETVKTIVYALLIAGVFRTLFFQPFWIPSGSMKDTLLIGDFLFVNKMAYGYSRHSCPFSMCPFDGRIFGSEPERGDVVVFRHPTEGTDFIKRVIGLPGDRIQVRVLEVDLARKRIGLSARPAAAAAPAPPKKRSAPAPTTRNPAPPATRRPRPAAAFTNNPFDRLLPS